MNMNDDEEDALNLFRQAVADVRPIQSDRVAQHVKKPKPIPRPTEHGEQQSFADSTYDSNLSDEENLSLPGSSEEIE
jgi:DNA-nicking Smr family endonuclease